MSCIPNVIKNSQEIVSYVLSNKDLKFLDRNDTTQSAHATQLGVSKFSSLTDENMPDSLIELIMGNFDDDTPIIYQFMQIQKYEIGDYILPHKDNYLMDLRLFNLTTSNLDGLVIEETKGNYKFIPDIAGQEITFNRNAWHWVNPVREKTRLSLVIGV